MEINEEQEDRLYQLLDDLAFDLVSKRRYNHILKELFAKNCGEWFAVSELSIENEILKEVNLLLDNFRIPRNDIVVTWLKRPNVNEKDPYSLILFYSDGLQWNTVAIFNRSTL